MYLKVLHEARGAYGEPRVRDVREGSTSARAP